MPIPLHCPHCGARGKAPDNVLNQQVRCARCKKQFVVTPPASGPPEDDVDSSTPPSSDDPLNFDDAGAAASADPASADPASADPASADAADDDLDELEEKPRKGKKDMARKKREYDDDYDDDYEDDYDDEEEDDRPRRSKTVKKPKAKRRSGGSGGGFGELLMYRQLFGPGLVAIVFWIFVIQIEYQAYGIFRSAYNYPTWNMTRFNMVLHGLGYALGGPLCIRMLCESVAALFHIKDALNENR